MLAGKDEYSSENTRDLKDNEGDDGKDTPSPLYILIAMNAMNLMRREKKCVETLR